MTLIFILIIIAIIILGLKHSHGIIFSPVVMTSVIWLIVMTLLLFMGDAYPQLSFRTYLCIFLWIVGIFVGSTISQSATYSDNHLDDPGTFFRSIYYILSLFVIPELYNFATIAIEKGTTGYWLLDLRYAALGKGSGFDKPFSSFFFLFTQCSYMIELLYLKKKNFFKIIPLIFCFLLFGFVMLSKTIFLNFFIYTCIILFFRGILRLKHLLIATGVFLAFLIVFQAYRHSSDVSNVQSYALQTYILSNLYAFDTLEPCSADHFGENTFRLVYSILYKLNLSDIEPVSPILDWIYKPIKTNTYTGLYPCYVDFGIIGVIITSLLIGLFLGYIFKKVQDGSKYHLLLYAFFSGVIVMQYATDEFLTTLTTNIKIALILWIPFLFKKFNLLSRDSIYKSINTIFHQ